MSTNQFSGTAMADLIAGRLNENDLQILATKPVQGLDVPPKRMALEDRYGDGVEGGPQFSQQREIVVPLGTRSFDVVQQLAAVFDPVGDPDAELVLTFVGLGRDAETTWRCWVVPDVLSFDVDQTATASEWWAMSARYIAKDPVIYSDAQVAHVFGSVGATDSMSTTPDDVFSFTATNLGLKTVANGRALGVEITAHGAVVDPYVRIAGDTDRADETVTWHLSMADGQTLATDDRLTARIGSLQVGGKARSGASKYVRWPRLRPGSQTIEIGCASGTISGRFVHRHTRLV